MPYFDVRFVKGQFQGSLNILLSCAMRDNRISDVVGIHIWVYCWGIHHIGFHKMRHRGASVLVITLFNWCGRRLVFFAAHILVPKRLCRRRSHSRGVQFPQCFLTRCVVFSVWVHKLEPISPLYSPPIVYWSKLVIKVLPIFLGSINLNTRFILIAI